MSTVRIVFIYTTALHLEITMVGIWVYICVSILTVSSAAPVAEDGEQESGFMNTDSGIDYLRGKRLNNNVYTITPCAAAAAASMPVARSPEMEYANFVPPEARYYAPSAYDYANSGYAGNMYRAEDPREMLRYSDTNFLEQMPTARFTLRSAPSAYAPLNTPNIGLVNSQYNVHTGSSASAAYGVFPNANVGNCNVPLLFSCTPTVVTGQMVKPETQIYGSPTTYSSSAGPHSNGYSSGVDGHYAQRIHVNHEQAMYENSAPVKATAVHSNEKAT
ncbi:uncharacterized protein LOC123879155 [Maniola jurtina]|uniref:uncharacterized protein LOC123879155 n=1 Tax=Maniola jurtina TaxID=191418 RepID=UPI001E68A181|nr:uncharacterized protein LOC123879155 [Maniola jurtina]